MRNRFETYKDIIISLKTVFLVVITWQQQKNTVLLCAVYKILLS